MIPVIAEKGALPNACPWVLPCRSFPALRLAGRLLKLRIAAAAPFSWEAPFLVGVPSRPSCPFGAVLFASGQVRPPPSAFPPLLAAAPKIRAEQPNTCTTSQSATSAQSQARFGLLRPQQMFPAACADALWCIPIGILDPGSLQRLIVCKGSAIDEPLDSPPIPPVLIHVLHSARPAAYSMSDRAHRR